jgi:hypothetical protein
MSFGAQVPEQNERQALEGHGGRVPDGPQYTLASVSLRIEGRFEAGHHLKPVFGKHLQVAAEWVKVISHEGDAALFGHDGDMGTRDGRKGMDIGKKHVAPGRITRASSPMAGRMSGRWARAREQTAASWLSLARGNAFKSPRTKLALGAFQTPLAALPRTRRLP